MKPSYARLKSHYYSSKEGMINHIGTRSLYAEIGYDAVKLLQQNVAYRNTCAVRMSLALLKTGVSFKGRLKIKTGKFKGKHIEPGAKLLADQLARPRVFGQPAVYKPAEFKRKAFGKRGVVLFHKISDYGGGHIDLIEPSNMSFSCNSNCYFSCRSIWFWSLR